MTRSIIILLLLIFTLDASAQQFNLTFRHYAGDSELSKQTTYYNFYNQPFSVSKFKYYISNISLTSSDGKPCFFESSYLIDNDDDESQRIILPVGKDHNFSSVEFIIGVDSLHNCSGIQSGALDPLNGMFWSWNTGYIFLKLEGISALSTLPKNMIEYHIGGYAYPNAAIRKIKIALNKTKSAVLKVDVNKLLSAVNKIDFRLIPSITGKENATMMADNFSSMFILSE